MLEMIKNKTRIKYLRKEIESNEKLTQAEQISLFEMIKENIGDNYELLDNEVEQGHRRTKLSENILAHNNCLDDFSEKVKEDIRTNANWVMAWEEQIDKIKNEMKIEEPKG